MTKLWGRLLRQNIRQGRMVRSGYGTLSISLNEKGCCVYEPVPLPF